MTGVVVLSEEVVVTMSADPELRGLTWLEPIRRELGYPRSGNCRACPGKSRVPLRASIFHAALSSLRGGKSNEAVPTKQKIGASVLRLPLPQGDIDI